MSASLDEEFSRLWDGTLSRLAAEIHGAAIHDIRNLCLIAYIQGSTFGGEEQHSRGMVSRAKLEERILARCAR